MERTPEVKTGFWTNQDRSSVNRSQYTTSEKYNILLQLGVGVFFGAAWPFLNDFLTRIWQWAWFILSPRPSKEQSLTETQSAELLETQVAELPETQIAELPGELVSHTERSPLLPNKQIDALERGLAHKNLSALSGLPASLFSIVLIGASIFFSVAGSFATTMPADSSGLSASRSCGSWSLKAHAAKELMDKDDLDQAQKEARSAQYARNCYGDKPVTSPDQCNFFNSQAIPYKESTADQECPFQNISLCAGGGYTAVRFSTGLADASLIGINSAKPPMFNRTTICVPLNMEQGFIKEIPPDEQHHEYQYEYDLGPVGDSQYQSNHTFRLFGDPFQWAVPTYSVSVYEATPYASSNYWKPIRGLAISNELDFKHPGKTYLTLMLISSCRIFYTARSNDYIFPAEKDPDNCPGKFCNTDPRARPLACIDWNEICTPDGKVCSSMEEDHEGYGVEYEFTRSALKKSSTFHAIQFRLGNALLAQEKVGDFESRPLDDDQWVAEARALFNTSLARIQFDALDIATGLGHDINFYESDTPYWAQGKLCGIYRFKLPKGYTNINVWATTWLCIGIALLYIFPLEIPWWEFNEEMKPCFSKGRWMIFDTLLWVLSRIIYIVTSGVWLKSQWFWRKACSFTSHQGDSTTQTSSGQRT